MALTIPGVSFLDGCLEVFMFFLEALCVCQGPGNGKPSRQHLLCTPDPAVHLKGKIRTCQTNVLKGNGTKNNMFHKI